MSHNDASRESSGTRVDPSRSYPDGTKALTPLSSLSLETLARLARAAKDEDEEPWITVLDLLADGYVDGFSAFVAFCTPERILGLIDAAQRGAEARSLMAELVDTGDCHYDHHGYCQGHSLHPRPCPHERAKQLRAAAPEERDDD